MTDKWEKKIFKIQAEMSKTKSQMDELNLKNVSLREKISNASTYRDQVRVSGGSTALSGVLVLLLLYRCEAVGSEARIGVMQARKRKVESTNRT